MRDQGLQTASRLAPRHREVSPDRDVFGYTKTVRLRRVADAEEIGKACAFLISELADFVTGAYIPVAGGKVRQMGA